MGIKRGGEGNRAEFFTSHSTAFSIALVESSVATRGQHSLTWRKHLLVFLDLYEVFPGGSPEWVVEGRGCPVCVVSQSFYFYK